LSDDDHPQNDVPAATAATFAVGYFGVIVALVFVGVAYVLTFFTPLVPALLIGGVTAMVVKTVFFAPSPPDD